MWVCLYVCVHVCILCACMCVCMYVMGVCALVFEQLGDGVSA